LTYVNLYYPNIWPRPSIDLTIRFKMPTTILHILSYWIRQFYLMLPEDLFR
jgi:hypothetical protein